MKKKKRMVIRSVIMAVLGAAVVYTLYANFNKDKIQKVNIGEKAPDFVLVDMEGEEHRLSEYEGQGVLLNFWGTWCKPCEKEMPYMNNQYKQYRDKGVQILAVNVGESDLAVKQFTDRMDLEFPILIDKDGMVQSAYGINPLPTTFMIDKDGTVLKNHTGELTESMIRDYMEQIKP